MAEAAITLASAAASAAAGAGASKLMADKPKMQKPARMPTEDSPEAIEARRREEAKRRQAGGRDSTILSGGGYANTQLGQ